MVGKLYFVVRTDVSAGMGEQRVFGVFDTEAEAMNFGRSIVTRRMGEFAVFEGSSIAPIARPV